MSDNIKAGVIGMGKMGVCSIPAFSIVSGRRS